MCAIFGIVGEYERKKAFRALELLKHRGPDYCGIEEQKRLFFSHLRLSILDTHHRSNQPLKHENILVSFNGEIYNYEALRSKLDFDFHPCFYSWHCFLEAAGLHQNQNPTEAMSKRCRQKP